MAKVNYTVEDIKRIAKDENVRFLRLMFTDIMGTIKNVEVPVSQLNKVLESKEDEQELKKKICKIL